MKFIKERGMKIGIKDRNEIASMKKGGKILAEILIELQKQAKIGITPLELNDLAEEMMKKLNVKPSFKGYNGFPAVICSNVNEEVVHGIPNDRKLENGDILTLDCGVIVDDLHTDHAITFGIGEISIEKLNMIKTGYKALELAIKAIKPGKNIRQISSVIQDTIEDKGYSVVRELAGHGIGNFLHEDPDVPNFRDVYPGPILREGMTLAIEPIFSLGNGEIETLEDGWTIITKDNSLAVQVEHTILVTSKGAEILTKI